MSAVTGHHGLPPDDVAALLHANFPSHEGSSEDLRHFIDDVLELLKPEVLAFSTEITDDTCESYLNRSSWLLAGLTVLADWIGSDVRHFPYVTASLSLEEYWPIAVRRARDAVRSSGITAGRPQPPKTLTALFPAIAASASPLQQWAESVPISAAPELFLIEDLTGSGKTEAALMLAQRLMGAGRGTGLFFALPTMATANAMHSRVAPLLDGLFEDPELVTYLLAHSGPRMEGMRTINASARPSTESYGSGELSASSAGTRWLADGRKKALLAQVGVGTIDQALLGALQVRHNTLRLVGLNRHILIVDEVHACDAYMTEILSELLRCHAAFGGTAILLSATFPLALRMKLVDAYRSGLGEVSGSDLRSTAFPLVTKAAATCEEVPLRHRPGTERATPVRFIHRSEDAVRRLVDAASAGLCACWIRNTVADALEAYDQLLEFVPEESIDLFHARFALGDRLEIERRVVQRFGKSGLPADRSGRIVVATQVVEQSLDLDFDVLLTDLAPIDLVIQRAGRLHRHAGRVRPAPVLEIHAPEWCDEPTRRWLDGAFRRTARVYDDPANLWLTQRELRARGELRLPNDSRELIEAVYGLDRHIPEGLENDVSRREGKKFSEISIGRMNRIALEHGYLRTSGAEWQEDAHVPTRLGDPTATLGLILDEASPRPWFRPPAELLHHAWALSQVSVRRALVSDGDPAFETKREAFERSHGIALDHVLPVVLMRTGEATWTGTALREGPTAAEPMRIEYSPRRGLQVTRGAK